MSERGMQSLSQLYTLRDKIADFNQTHDAFLRFLQNALDNLERSKAVETSSSDYNNLHILVDLFSEKFANQQEKIESALAELRILIDR